MLSAEDLMDFQFAVYDSETKSVVSSVTITSTDLHLAAAEFLRIYNPDGGNRYTPRLSRVEAPGENRDQAGA